MNIRPKTVRRLMVLLAILLLLAGGVALLLIRSMNKEKAAIARMRQAAFAAYEHHDNKTAVSLFSSYVNSGADESNDAEAIYVYGMARAQVPSEGNRHIAEAINLFQKYLDLAPSDPHNVSHQLLALYTRARYNQEALTLANRLLETNPRDTEALRDKVIVYISQRSFADALSTCHTLNQIDPFNASWQDRELQLMAELHQQPQQIVAHAKQLLDAHPQDPRFDLVMAEAQSLAGDDASAAASVQSAARLDPPDALTALETIALLERGSRSDLVDDLLKRAIAKFKDASLEEVYVRRFFERMQYAELAAQLKDVNLKSATTSSNLLAYDAIALFHTDHRTRAEAIVAVLASRPDPVSGAWAEAIRAHFAVPPLEPAAAMKAYSDAIEKDRTNAVLPSYLGDAHQALGETDEAIRDWNIAARLSPTWAEPIYRISRALSSVGRYAGALMAADALRHRAPDSLESQIAFAVATWGRIQNNPAEVHGDAGAKLLKDFNSIRARAPQESDTLSAYTALISRRGDRDQAIEVVRSAIHSNTPLPEPIFESLLAISRQEHWGIEGEILDAAEKAHGMTPAIAYDRAITLYRDGKTSEALQSADGYRKAHPRDIAWQLDDVRFRDVTGQPDPSRRWKALCEEYPDDIRVQYAALSAPFRFTDRTFWRQTIDRVKTLTGPDGQVWQIEQARFTLGDNPSSQQLASVIDSLQKLSAASPELGEIHRLLAQAFLLENKTEDLSKAINELTTAHAELPNSFEITSQLTALMINQGRRDDAATLVKGVAQEPNLDPMHRVWAAQIYGELGSFDAAINLLTPSDMRGLKAEDRNLLLANLYQRAGRIEPAKAIYDQIIQEVSATPDQLIAAAKFFAGAHDSDAAGQCVARLKEMKLAPDSVELLRSELQELQGHPDAAAASLADACRTYPKSRQVWFARASLALGAGKIDEADQIAAEGLAALASDPSLDAMRACIAQLRSIDRGDAVLLLDPISRGPRQPYLEPTLTVLSDAKARSLSPQQTASALRPVADRYPRFLALQEILAGRYMAAGDPSATVEVASHAADALPGDPQPLKFLTQVQFAQGNWDLARSAALRWRQCSLANPLDADLEIARIDLTRPDSDPHAALNQLEPYVKDSAPEEQKLAATPLYCQALLASGRIDEAAARLAPLVAKSLRWAAVWMELSVSAKDLETAAAWLRRLAPLLPTDSQPQQIALAETWERVGIRLNDSSTAFDAARNILRPIVAGANVPPDAWRLWAFSNQMCGDLVEAERAWQKLLDQEPKDPSAHNNLAFALLLDGGKEKLARAESLAKEAIVADPNTATFYDTLARIEEGLGKSSSSIRDFRIALEKDPNDVEAMIGLADELQSEPAGREEARSLLGRINARLDAGVPLLQPIRKQLEHVKTALSSSANPGD